MKYLVGESPMEPGQRVEITFSDGKKQHGSYVDTYGYKHVFALDNGGSINLSNHFMHLKGIRVCAEKANAEDIKSEGEKEL